MKYSGNIAFIDGVKETKPDVFTPILKERHYTGDYLKNTLQFQQIGTKSDDDLVVPSRISIISDSYLRDHCHAIQYIVINGQKWRVRSVSVNPPRIIVETGGVYNGEAQERIEYDS